MNLVDQFPFFQEMDPELQGIMLQLLLILVVLILIQILRMIVNRVLDGPVKRAVTKTSFGYDDAIYNAIKRPSRLVIIALSLIIATTILDFGADIQTLASVIARSLIITSILFGIYNLVDLIAFTPEILQRITGLHVEARLLPFLRTVLKVLILLIGALIIIQEFGYDATGLLASFGVVGLAFSLAAQDTAANVFGFAAIVSDNPFQVGDYIVTSDFAGVVEQVGVRSTRVRKLDQSLVSVPNNALTASAVTNWSRLTKRRLDFMIGVTYDTTASQMRYLLDRLRSMLNERENIEEDSVIVHFVKFNDSSLDVRIICNITLPDWAAFTAEAELINLEVMDVVEEVGLSFAFPSTSIYVETLPSSSEDQRAVPVPPRYRVKSKKDVAIETPPSEAPDQDND